jgi:hypothetical protein
VNARRHWAVRILNGDTPEIAKAKGKWPGVWEQRVVKVVAIVLEIFEKPTIVLSPKLPQ